VDLFVFSTEPGFVRQAVRAGAAGVVVDWERRGKVARQAGADTQINGDTPDHLRAVRAATPEAIVLCRTNGWSRWTPAEIDLAVQLGADEVLLPMVRRPQEVEAALDVVDGRCGLGILVETTDAVHRIDELVRLPLSRVYVGLNDLMIDRGAVSLFEPLVDGTVERVRATVAAAGVGFGLAGVTVPEAGHPVPCRLIIGELARLGADFTFLRRSFHADVAGRDVAVELPRIAAAIADARGRPSVEVIADRQELEALLAVLGAERAG
jgi:citrate lyase beta subunit